MVVVLLLSVLLLLFCELVGLCSRGVGRRSALRGPLVFSHPHSAPLLLFLWIKEWRVSSRAQAIQEPGEPTARPMLHRGRGKAVQLGCVTH